MYSESNGGWIMALLATLLALWTYRLSRKNETAHEQAFESIEFLGETYEVLHDEEENFMLRLKILIEKIKQGSFGFLYENKEPHVVLLPINEFYRLKAIEEHLEDQKIAKIIEERIHTHAKEESSHPQKHFDDLRAKIYDKRKHSKSE